MQILVKACQSSSLSGLDTLSRDIPVSELGQVNYQPNQINTNNENLTFDSFNENNNKEAFSKKKIIIDNSENNNQDQSILSKAYTTNKSLRNIEKKNYHVEINNERNISNSNLCRLMKCT